MALRLKFLKRHMPIVSSESLFFINFVMKICKKSNYLLIM